MSGREIRYPLLRWLIAIVAVLWLVGGAVEHLGPASSTVDTAHGWAASAHGSAVNADHLQCGDDIALLCPFVTAVADLTLWGGALLALGALCAFIAVHCSFDRDAHTGRWAPKHGGSFLVGRDLLTRLCLSRR